MKQAVRNMLAELERGLPFKAALENELLAMEESAADRLMLLVRESRGAWAALLEAGGGRALFVGNALSGTPVALATVGFEVVILDRSRDRLAFAVHRGRALSASPPAVVAGGDGSALPFAAGSFDLVVQDGGLPSSSTGWGHSLGECARVARGELVLVADNRLGYKRSGGKHGVFHVPSPFEYLGAVLAPARGERTLAGYRRALRTAGIHSSRAFALYPHSGEFVHVVALDEQGPVLPVGRKERENRLKMVGQGLGLFPVFTPSFAIIGGGRGGPSRTERILSQLAERSGRPMPRVPRATQLVATRGNTVVLLAGPWCLHLPLSPSQRQQVERHHEIIARIRAQHAGVPVPEPIFVGELEGAFLACETQLAGLTAPQLTGDHAATRHLLADSARMLAQLVVEPEHVFDDASFEELVGSKLDVVARYCGLEATKTRIARLCDEARERLLGTHVPLVLYHADLRSKHVQVDQEGHVIGYLDWGSAEDRGLPYYDLLHLLAHERKQEIDLPASEAWRIVRERNELREHEATALDDYGRALGLTDEFRRVVEAIYPLLVGATAENNWDYSRPRWVHRQFGV
jgi:SAM-dependent methyltransferase/aminoglycoside phosphotransferase (APT) family kinase protein